VQHLGVHAASRRDVGEPQRPDAHRHGVPGQLKALRSSGPRPIRLVSTGRCVDLPIAMFEGPAAALITFFVISAP
jgi:hypothetical protein